MSGLSSSTRRRIASLGREILESVLRAKVAAQLPAEGADDHYARCDGLRFDPEEPQS